jgi:DNA-binding transcriptional LysR family regulator
MTITCHRRDSAVKEGVISLHLMPSALTYFCEVARTGSVTEAAATQHLAASAVSRQIAKLERDIGVPLFARHARGMTLTEAGHRLLAHARRHEVESSTLIAEIRSVDATEHGSVTVACTEGFSQSVVPRAMASVHRTHPSVTFTLDVVGPDEASRRVVDARADVAVTFSLGRRTDVTVEHSVTVPICAVVAPGHPLTDRDSVDLADICSYPLALSTTGSSQRELFDAGIRLEGLSPHVGLQCERLAPILEFARSSDGVALVSDLGGDRKSGLTYIPLVHPVFAQRRAEIHTMRGRPPSARIVALIDALTDLLASSR